MKKTAIWLSFDLGLRGDYERLYTWLDAHGAKECGENTAYLIYEFDKELIAELATDIENAFEQTPRVRVYALFSDGTTFRGRFIIGQRNASPPWAGYAPKKVKEIDESI